ncbi:hypothetical protein PQX77_006612 [Marasmius sp. AFHP31]|nr:hypothetical protein PQX77_006612 [Marasmius sp. AFHP31]
MNSARFTNPIHNNAPSPASGDTSDRIRDGAYTNRNANPLSNTLNGDTSSLAANTYIQNYQCQNPQNHYTNCNFYGADHAPAAQNSRAIHPIAQTSPADSFYKTPVHPAHTIEPRSLLIPLYWPWILLTSFIRIILRATVITDVEQTPRSILPRHARDLEDHPNTVPPSIPIWAPASPADQPERQWHA